MSAADVEAAVSVSAWRATNVHCGWQVLQFFEQIKINRSIFAMVVPNFLFTSGHYLFVYTVGPGSHPRRPGTQAGSSMAGASTPSSLHLNATNLAEVSEGWLKC